jgi:hypothetical protein
MAKRGKASRGAKRAAPKRGKARSPKRGVQKSAKGKIAWYGPFTRYVHSIEASPGEVERFKADRHAHISVHERTHRVTFTARQKKALVTGSVTAINAEITAESTSPQPIATHGGPITFVGGGGGGSSSSGSTSSGGPTPWVMHG